MFLVLEKLNFSSDNSSGRASTIDQRGQSHLRGDEGFAWIWVRKKQNKIEA